MIRVRCLESLDGTERGVNMRGQRYEINQLDW